MYPKFLELGDGTEEGCYLFQLQSSKSLRVFKWLSVNKQNSFLRFGRFSTNSLATLTSGSLSTRGLLEFKIESELNLRCFIVDRSHVLIFKP